MIEISHLYRMVQKIEKRLDAMEGKSSAAEPKDCEFCGSGDVVTVLVDALCAEKYVLCEECMARGPALESPDAAVDAWNKRAGQ